MWVFGVGRAFSGYLECAGDFLLWHFGRSWQHMSDFGLSCLGYVAVGDWDQCFGVWAGLLVARRYFVFWDSSFAVHSGLAEVFFLTPVG